MLTEEACYVYEPAVESQRASKRRKTSRQDDHGVVQPSFLSLLRGAEESISVEGRYDNFRKAWGPKEDAIRAILESTNVKLVGELEAFIRGGNRVQNGHSIPTGLLVQDVNNGAFTNLSDHVTNKLNKLENTLCLSLAPGPNSNLKSILKSVNQSAKTRLNGSKIGSDLGEEAAGRYLNYDLQILFEYVKLHTVDKVVLLFQDSEAFDGGLLSDLINLLSSWTSRIPFALLFCVTTSVQLFQAKLSRSAIRCLQGQLFHVECVDLDEIFRIVHSPTDLYLSPASSKVILERHRDHVESPQSLSKALKFAYMAHFFSDSLSIWLDPNFCGEDSQHLLAVTHISSFRSWIENMLQDGNHQKAQVLLTDTKILAHSISEGVASTKRALKNIVSAVNLIYLVRNTFAKHKNNAQVAWSELYMFAMSGQLHNSSIIEETLLLIRRLNAADMMACLSQILELESNQSLKDTLRDLNTLVVSIPDASNLKSSRDNLSSSLRTTVVAQKVELSRYATSVSLEEAEYTKILDRIVETLNEIFESSLVNPQELLLHEAFMYDGKLQYREAFTPRTRFGVERAMSSPHDYLACECCTGKERGLVSSLPPIAIVYQLYMESGSVINTADLWSAFWTIVKPEDRSEQEVKYEEALALFSRALAEMKYLGMIKNSKKKADHLAKLLWKGL